MLFSLVVALIIGAVGNVARDAPARHLCESKRTAAFVGFNCDFLGAHGSRPIDLLVCVDLLLSLLIFQLVDFCSRVLC